MKIHLGCGKRDFGYKWLHVDGGNYPHVYEHDITLARLADNFADVIYASHLLSYFDRDEVMPILQQWYRVLKPEGILRLAVPDFEAMARLYIIGHYPLKNFLGPLYGKMQMGEQTIYHKTVYDYDSLSSVLTKAGFNGIRHYNWKHTEHADIDDCSQAYLPHMDKSKGVLISLNVEASKWT